ncbi:MAG: hypothetical protein OXC91_04340 [Rhodobacteraceae bacterium]|nr:hypothetical protein [Paracoccaceae bacterium]
MSDIESIKGCLGESGLDNFDVIESLDEDHDFLVFYTPMRRPENKVSPSKKTLRKIRRSIENNHDVRLKFIRTQDDKSDERALLNLLVRRFGDDARNAIISPGVQGKWNVWVDFEILGEDQEGEVHSIVSEYMQAIDKQPFHINILGDGNIPADTTMLRMLRIMAPVTIEELKSALTEKEFHIPSRQWLNRTLDRFRKSKLVVRRQDGHYFLTAGCLKRLGTMIGRDSPDIHRALVLNNRHM